MNRLGGSGLASLPRPSGAPQHERIEMDIEDAFTEEAISAADTNIQGVEEAALKDVIKRIYVTNDIANSDDDVQVAALAFVAGRTYQADLQPTPTLAVPMSPALVGEFMEYLSQRGAT